MSFGENYPVIFHHGSFVNRNFDQLPLVSLVFRDFFRI